MQASNCLPDHPPGTACTFLPGGWRGASHALSGTRRAKSSESRIEFESRIVLQKSNGFQRLRHPRRRFFMHFCAFWQFSKFNVRCNVNSMFAKLVFSEICTQKAHFAQLWAVLGSISRAGRRCNQGAPFCIPLPKSNGFQSRTKVETLPKLNGHPLPESRMILREKISGKVDLGIGYVLLLRDSGICPVILTISHGYLFQTVVLEEG